VLEFSSNYKAKLFLIKSLKIIKIG